MQATMVTATQITPDTYRMVATVIVDFATALIERFGVDGAIEALRLATAEAEAARGQEN